MPPSSVFGTYRDIIQELTAQIATRVEANEPLEILIPSRAVASSITRSLLRQVPRGLTGLNLQTPDSLARALLNGRGLFPRAASDAERQLAMSAAASAIDEPSLRLAGIAAMLDRTYRDMRDSGLTIDLFTRRAERRTRDGARTAAMIAAWKRYEQNLRAIKAVDPADLLEQSIALAADARQQIVFGFYDVTGMQERLLRALGAAERIEAFYVPVPLEGGAPSAPYRYASPYVSRLVETQIAIEALPASPAASWTVTAHESLVSELRSVCRSARALLDSGSQPEEVAIVCRSVDRHEAESLVRIADEFALPLSFARTLDLRAHRFGRALVHLLLLRSENFPRGQVIGILRDGTHLDGASPGAIRAADYATRDAEIAGGPPDLVRRALASVRTRKSRIAGDVATYLSWTMQLDDLTRNFDRPRRARAWAATIRTIAAMFRVETEPDLAALDSIEEIAQLLLRADSFSSRFTAEDVASMIESAEPIALDARSRGVWFGDVMSLRGRSFEMIFLIGMQQDRFPQRRSEDPLLGDGERRAIGLPPIGDGRSEEEMLFAIVRAAAARHLEFAFATTDFEGKLLRPSSFLQRLAFEREADPKRQPAIYRDFPAYVRETIQQPPAAFRSARESLNAAILADPRSVSVSPQLGRALRLALHAGGRSAYDGFLTIDEPLAARIRELIAALSATYVEDFGECPHKFLVRRLLRIEELPDPDHEAAMQARDKGSLDHAILERFYRESREIVELKHPELPRLSKKGAEILARLVDEEFDRFDRERPPFIAAIRRIERSVSRRGLERFLGRDLQDLLENGLHPLHVEYAFGTSRGERGPDYPDSIPVQAGDLAFAVRGIIDRIDANASGRHRVVDYKTSAGKHKDLSERIVVGQRLQLALYAIAIQSIFELSDESVSGVIKGIRGAATKLDAFSFRLDQCKPALLETLDAFATAMSRGQFPAVPSSEACEYCVVNHSCRTRFDQHERSELAQFDNALALIRAVQKAEIA